MPRNLPDSYIAPTRVVNQEIGQTTVIILAANIGHGMKSYGPKSLLSINEKTTLFEYQIGLVNTVFPQSDIILVVGFFADRMIKRCPRNIRIVENQLFETTNEVEQLRLALNCTITNNVLVLKDNVIFNVDTLKTIKSNESCIIYDSQQKMDKNDIGVTVVNGYATTFSYDILTKWGHLVYLIGKDLNIVKRACSNRNCSKMYLFEILNMLLDKVEKIKAIEPKNMEIVKIDNSKDLEKLRGYNESINC